MAQQNKKAQKNNVQEEKKDTLRRIVKISITAVVILCLSFLFYDLSKKSNDEEGNKQKTQQTAEVEGAVKVGSQIGKDIEDYELTDFNTQEKIKVSDFSGQKVALVFWASWCPYCQQTVPGLQEISEEEEGIQIIGVNMKEVEEDLEGPIDFVKKFGLTYPNTTGSQEMYDAFNIQSFPTAFLIDENGVVKEILVGAHTKKQFIDEIKQMDK